MGATGVAAAMLLVVRPVSAHDLGGEVDAPLPFVVYVVAAVVAVALSFAFAAISDSTSAPDPEPGRARTVPRPVRLTVRLIGLVAWAWVVAQAFVGGSSDAEIASLILWVLGWVGLALVSALIGPLWSWLDPFSTLHDLGAALARWLGVRLPGRSPWRRRVDAWPAVVFLGFFVWLELAARVGGGRELGFVLLGYTAITLAFMAWYGRDRWRERGEVFSVWFGLLGRLALYGLDGPASEGRVRRRGFGSALAGAPWSTSLLVVLALATGSVIWDGVSQTQAFFDVFGDPGLLGDTLLLAFFLAGLAALVVLVGRRVGLAATGAGLVPVATGYLVAHYLSYLLIEGQRLAVALSDPLQQGWDLLGTVTWEPQDEWLNTSVVWTIQVLAVVIGHVAGAWLGHTVARRTQDPERPVSQWPLAALMIAMTVLALWSLGQNLVFVTETSTSAAMRPPHAMI